jgi:hypothetical protein
MSPVITKFIPWLERLRMRACSVCSEILGRDDLYATYGTKSASVAKLQRSSRAGCLACEMALDAVEAFEPGWAINHYTDGAIKWVFGISYPLARCRVPF